jgi:putative inorganic carbon (hco3(-)) transporter
LVYDVFPDFVAARTYLVLILACFVVSFPAVWKQLSTRSLAVQPITVCVLGLIAAIMLSHLTRFALADALSSGGEFAKVALYYLLLIGLVNTPARLRRFLFWLACFILGHAVVAVLQYHQMIHAPYFEALAEETGVNPVTGAQYLLRLRGSGIFHNPNELCYPAGMAIMIGLFYLGGRQSILIRVLSLAALAFLGYTVTLTHSRGGFVGLLIGLLSFLFARFGWRKALPFAAAILPILFLLFSGRQTDLDLNTGTGQGRIQLWNDGLVKFTTAPFFGLGTGLFVEEIGHVVHNSYIQAYSELGFFGGTIFLGAFYCALVTLHRLGLCKRQIVDPDLERLRPYLVGLIGGFMGCMLTMSLTDMLPTYTILGLATVYRRVTVLQPPLPSLPRFNAGLILRMATVSALTLIVFRLYVWSTFVPG